MKRIPLYAALAAALLASASLQAADGFVTGDVALRAGPDPEYPRVAELRTGTEVAIMGCVNDWSWCDVSAHGERGWVAGEFLEEEYQGRRVVIREYGVRIGLPVVSFEFVSYWDSNYRSRPWYAERTRYARVTPRFTASASVSGRTTSKSTEVTASGSATTRATDTTTPAETRRTDATTTTSVRTESARRTTAQADGTRAVEQQSTPKQAVKSDTTTVVEKQATTQRGEDQKSAIEPSADRSARPAQARAKPNESRPEPARAEDKGKPPREKPAKKEKSKDENDDGPDSE